MFTRKIFIFLAALLVSSCSIKSTPTPRANLSLVSLKSVSTKFNQLATDLVDVWNSQDKKSADALFTEDAVMIDKSFGDHNVGSWQIIGSISSVSAFGKNWQAQAVDQYIGMQDGLAVDKIWNITLGDVSFTQEHPVVEVDWIQANGDKISNWTLFYGLDFLEELKIPSADRLTKVKSLLAAYQSAWSSGNANTVASLYSDDAVREDTLFMEKQLGKNEIRDYAKSFFAWYPGAQWNLSLSFAEGNGSDQITGGLYTIKVPDVNGSDCEIKVAVLFHTADDLITGETLFYQPQSLITCGWSK